MRYTIEIDGTGCYYTGNPSRAEDGERPETLIIDGSLAEAIEAAPALRNADIYDTWGDLVARVEYGPRGRLVRDAQGDQIYESRSDDE